MGVITGAVRSVIALCPASLADRARDLQRGGARTLFPLFRRATSSTALPTSASARRARARESIGSPATIYPTSKGNDLMSKTEKPTILTDVYGTRPPKAQDARRQCKAG